MNGEGRLAVGLHNMEVIGLLFKVVSVAWWDQNPSWSG